MEKPKCPYCGGEMRYAFNGDIVGTHFFICETCLSRSPAVSFNDDPYAAAVSHEMTAREFVIAHHRMCQSKMECVECRICHDDGEPRSCAVLMGLNPDDTVAVVEAWAREHPEEVNDE